MNATEATKGRGGLALGVAIGLTAAFILPWLEHELRLQGSYNMQYGISTLCLTQPD